ncbi:MAG: NUDIX domain-containing protein, partial [Kineosporiaceae bacterium]|jgi:8-oxo-dGTP diphosphatase
MTTDTTGDVSPLVIAPSSRHTIVPAVHLLLTDPQRGILLLRRANTGFFDGHYSVPAGHVEPGEPARQALAREVDEEIGLHLDPSDLDCCLTMHRRSDGHERVDFFFTAQRWDGQPANREPHKCDDLAWHPTDDLPPNMVPYVRAAIEQFVQGRSYTEFGWDPTVIP